MQKVLIIIPTYNEVDSINVLISSIEQTAQYMQAYTLSLLIVDDHSPDGTARKVKALQKKHNNIALLSGQKDGLGRAYIRGLQYALKDTDFDICVLMDADLSHDPKDIPQLLKAIEEGSDYVIGSRYITGGHIGSGWPMSRKLMSRLANFCAHKLAGISDDISDLTSGFKAIRRIALKQIDLDSIRANGYVFQVSLLHAFLLQGLAVSEVPITFTVRRQGVSKLNVSDIVEFLYQTYKLNPNAPVQRFVRFGFVGTCGSVVNLSVLSLLVNLAHMNAQVAVVIAIECSIIFNFILHHYYTFRGYGSYRIRMSSEPTLSLLRKLGKFNLGSLGGALISFTVFSLLFKLEHLVYLIADVLAIIAAMSWNYYVSTRHIWPSIDD